MHRHTAYGRLAMKILQCTAMEEVGNVIAAMHCHTA